MEPSFTPGDDGTRFLKYLRRLGYLRGDITTTGSIASIPAASIKTFQRRYGLAESGILDKPTFMKMTAPRCAFPDMIDPLAAITTGPWQRKDLRYCFGSLGTMGAKVPEEEIKSTIRDAFDVWASSGEGIIFVESEDSNACEILIEGRPPDDHDRDLSGSLVAHADLPPGFSLIVQEPPLPLHFDESELWWIGAKSGHHDIQSIAIHEIGHCLGLLHTSEPMDVMYSFVTPGEIKRSLSDNDRERISNLYRGDDPTNPRG